jgi:O-antigen/teichoic acid export membrane protein
VESAPLPLRDKAVKGFQWNLIGQAMIYVVMLTGTVIMTRLLSPAEVGLFGMLSVLSNFGSLIIGFGLAHAIVQNQHLDQDDLSTLFWFSLAIGVGVTLIFFLAAPPVAVFFQQPELVELMRIFSVFFVVNSLSTVPLGILSKAMQFRHLVFSQFMSALASYLFGIFLAWQGYGTWSLLAQALANHLIYVILNFYFSRWRPSWVVRLSSLSKIFRFTRNLLPSQLLDFAATNLDLVLVGKFFGKTELGLYGRASALLQMPVNSIGTIFNKTFFPVFAALQAQPDNLVRQYLRTTRFLTLSLMPVLLFTAIAAEKIVLVLFGEEWLGMAALTSYMALVGCFAMYNQFNDSLITSQGQTALLLRINAIDKLVLMAAMVIGMQFGLYGVIIGKIAAMAAMFFPRIWAVSRVVPATIALWASVQKKMFVAIFISGLTVFWLNHITPRGLLPLAATVALGYGALFVVLTALREETWLEGLEEIKRIIQNRRKPRLT